MRYVPSKQEQGREKENDMQPMKMPHTAMGGLIAAVLLTTTQGFAQYYPGYSEQTVYVTEVTQVLPPPKYALWEGVDAAVKALLQRGVPITFDNVNEELYVMHKNNDIHLPYDPYWRGHMKRPLTKKKREKAMFENELRKRIEIISRSYAEKGVNVGDPTPHPSQFSSKESFVSAYIAFKMGMVDDEIRARYRRKLGGMADYRRDMQSEAVKLWTEARRR